MTPLLPGIHTQTAEVADLGTIRYTLEIPEGYDGTTPVPLVLVLHYAFRGAQPEPWYGRKLLEVFRPGLADLNGILLAPDALGGRWTDAANERLALELVRRVLHTYAIERRRVLVTGFSLGGQGAWSLGGRHQDLFTGALPVAGPVAGGDLVWNIPVFVIHSDQDERIPIAAVREQAAALRQQGARIEFRTALGLGHYETAAYVTYVGEGVRWLQAQWQ